MFGILKNAWIDEVRARSRRNRVLAPEEAGEHVGDDSTEAHIQVWSVEAAMSRLPEEQRFAVSLVLIEGLSYKEIADAVGTTEGAARVHYHNAMRAVKEFLDE